MKFPPTIFIWKGINSSFPKSSTYYFYLDTIFIWNFKVSKPELPISNSSTENVSGSFIQNNDFGHQPDCKNNIKIEESKPELQISNSSTENISGSVIENNDVGHQPSNDKSIIEIDELKPGLPPISNLFSGHEILTEQVEYVIQKDDLENQALTKQKCHICDKAFDNLDLHFFYIWALYISLGCLQT